MQAALLFLLYCRSNLEIVNLQHTLESREQDIDSLEKDLFECREIIYTQMEKIRGSEEKEKQMDMELKSVVAENTELKVCESLHKNCLLSTCQECI